MTCCGCGPEQTASLERKTLRILLAINGAMFVGELLAGLLADSTGLLADSLDMLADASVYGIALHAVRGDIKHQSSAASASGMLQILLGTGVLVEALRRFYSGSNPASAFMMASGAVALVANVVCVLLIYKHRAGGIHMRASWIFSANDVIANLGVIVSGALVMALGSRLPDLLIGVLIAIVVVRGGARILVETRKAGGGSAAT